MECSVIDLSGVVERLILVWGGGTNAELINNQALCEEKGGINKFAFFWMHVLAFFKVTPLYT